jgi:hypothetical protein
MANALINDPVQKGNYNLKNYNGLFLQKIKNI